MSKPSLAFVHDLPIGGAKRAFYSLIPILAESFAITVFEFAREDNGILDLAASSLVRRRSFKPPRLPNARLLRLPVVGAITVRRATAKGYAAIAAEVNRGDFAVALVSHCRYLQSPRVIPLLTKPVVYFCHEPPRAAYEPPVYRPYCDATKGARNLKMTLDGWLIRRWDRLIVARASALIANSHYSADVLYRVYGEKATPAQMGVDATVFRPLELPVENKVLSIGSLIPSKAHDFAIACVAAVPAQKRPALVICSPAGTQAGPERLYLESLAARFGVQLEFCIGVDDAQLARLYSSAIATIYCPHLEPFGLVSLESMACGVPVLGVCEGGLKETVRHGETGFLLPWRAEDFARALTFLMDQPDQRSRMGRAGVEHVRRTFTWKRCAETTGRVIMATMNGEDMLFSPRRLARSR